MTSWSGPLTTEPHHPELDLDAWVGQRTATYRFDNVDIVTGYREQIFPRSDTVPTLSHDTGRIIKRTVSNLWFDAATTAALNTISARIEIFMILGGVSFPLGQYLFNDQTRARYTSGVISSNSAYDNGFIVDQPLEHGFPVHGLDTIGPRLADALLREILTGLPISYTIAPTLFQSAGSWMGGTSRGYAVEQLSTDGDYLCLSPATKVLTSDLRWRPLAEMNVGDEIVGFDEQIGGGSQRFRRSVIESLNRTFLPSYEIKTALGSTIASEDHMWLVKRPVPNRLGHRRAWKKTRDLQIGDQIIAFGEPWEEEDSWEAGYLAGFFDGEGSLGMPGGRGAHTSKVPRLSFGQNEGPILHQVMDLLIRRGYGLRPSKNTKSNVVNVIFQGGKYDAMRFLGSVRPKRLLAKSSALWEGRATWGFGKADNTQPVLSITPVGPRSLIAIGTSTKTLVADGLLSHNSPWFDNTNVMRFIRSFDPATAIPTFDFDSGNKVMRDPPPIETDDLLGAANRFVVVSNGSTVTTSPIVGSYDVPSSAPHSIANRGFVISKTIDRQVEDVGQAQAIAANLGQRQTIFERVELTTAPDPRHDSYDVILWQGEKWLETAWSLPLIEGGKMRHTARKTYS